MASSVSEAVLFPQLVQKHFAFLTADYGCTLGAIEEHSFTRYVRYDSPVCRVYVIKELDRLFGSINILPDIPGKYRKYDLGILIAFKTNSDTIPFVQLKNYKKDPEGALDQGLAQLAEQTGQYGDDLMRGDIAILPALEQWIEEYAAKHPPGG